MYWLVVFISAVSATHAQEYKLEQQRIPVHDLLKLTLADWGSYHHRNHKGPGTYAYGYDIEDPYTGNIQFKQEERHINGTVTGSYGYVEPDGNPRVMYYVSDHNGYRVRTGDSKKTQTTLLGTVLKAPSAQAPPAIQQLPPHETDLDNHLPDTTSPPSSHKETDSDIIKQTSTLPDSEHKLLTEYSLPYVYTRQYAPLLVYSNPTATWNVPTAYYTYK